MSSGRQQLLPQKLPLSLFSFITDDVLFNWKNVQKKVIFNDKKIKISCIEDCIVLSGGGILCSYFVASHDDGGCGEAGLCQRWAVAPDAQYCVKHLSRAHLSALTISSAKNINDATGCDRTVPAAAREHGRLLSPSCAMFDKINAED